MSLSLLSSPTSGIIRTAPTAGKGRFLPPPRLPAQRMLELRTHGHRTGSAHGGIMACSARRSLIEKQHTCVGCGCVFRYGMDPTDWRTPLMSQTGKARDSVRLHPCPDCGLYQPEMVMWLKVWHPLVTIVALPALLIVLCIGMADGSANAVVAAQVGVGLCVTMALVHFVTAFSNCNGDLKANLALAQQEIADGKL